MFGQWPECGIQVVVARAALVASALLAIAPSRIQAQDSAAVSRRGWMIGGSLGMIGSGNETLPLELTTVGMNFTDLQPGSIGADISLGTVPRAFVEGLFLLGARFDATVPVPIAPGVLLLPSAGLSLIGGASVGGGTVSGGYNVGAAAVLGAGRVGFRTALTWHQLAETRTGIWLLEVGIARLPAFRSR